MTNLKIENRKNTTKAGVEALINLVESFDLCDDIGTVSGSTFPIKADIGESNIVWADQGRIKIKNGSMKIYAIKSDCEYGRYEEIYSPWHIKKINFTDVVESLLDAIGQYNVFCREKDEQIEKFLKLCADCK